MKSRKTIMLAALWLLVAMVATAQSRRQEIQISQFEQNQLDLGARMNPVLDRNGDACARIKFHVRDTSFVVTSNMGVLKRETELGVISVWVPQGTKRLTIRHEGVLPLVYNIPMAIVTKTGWTITKSADWLTVNPMSGNNTETVRVSAGKNPTSEPRYATLTVKGGKAPEKYVMVTQLAGTVVPEVKTLTADVSSLAFEAKGEAKIIKIASNTTWSITGKPDWCLLSESSGSGSRDITVTANENTKTEDRSGQIVIEGDGVSKVVIDVTQKAKELQEPGSDDNTPPA